MTDQVFDSMLGRDISHLIPPADGVPGIVAMPSRDQEVWERAVGHLHVRDNDVHTIYAYGLATALLSDVPAARAVASISLAPQRLALDGGEVR